MMEDDAGVSHDEIRKIVGRAFVLQRYLLRRAWGLLYAMVSLSIFLAVFGSLYVELSGISKELATLTSLTISMAASGSAFIVILWTFKRVRNTAEIRLIKIDRSWADILGYRFLVPLWAGVNGIMILSITLSRQHAPLVLLLIYGGLIVYLYYALALSFPGKFSLEAVIAISSLAMSAVASIALMLFTTKTTPYVVLWTATIVAWIFSAAYARTRPIPVSEEHT